VGIRISSEQRLFMPRTILVVEDDEHVSGLVAATLSKHGYVVFQAKNSMEAMRLWADSAQPFDVLISDVRLEEEDDGFVLADKLLAIRPNVPVIFISGDKDCFASPAIQRFGDSPFIAKPFDLKKLVKAVGDILEQSPGGQV
jgi:DNA-binding NtrC family response regulator